MSDDEPANDQDELAQAERLRRALDEGLESAPGVDDAIDAAGVVSLLKAPLLSEQRADAVLASVEHAIEVARRRKRTRLMLASGVSALAVAAAALLLVPTQREAAPMSAAAPGVAPPAEAPAAAGAAVASPASLLREAQIAWLKAPSAETHGALDHALGAYRVAQLDDLERRYAR